MSALTSRSLIFWRHAQAVEADLQMLDMARPLTKKGHAQAKSIAKWLKKEFLEQMSSNITMVSSPAVRAIQTIQALDTPFSVRAELSPEATESEVVRLIENTQSDILLVGHEPWISEVIARFLRVPVESLDVKKGSLWCLLEHKTNATYNAQTSYTLVCAQLPD